MKLPQIKSCKQEYPSRDFITKFITPNYWVLYDHKHQNIIYDTEEYISMNPQSFWQFINGAVRICRELGHPYKISQEPYHGTD